MTPKFYNTVLSHVNNHRGVATRVYKNLWDACSSSPLYPVALVKITSKSDPFEVLPFDLFKNATMLIPEDTLKRLSTKPPEVLSDLVRNCSKEWPMVDKLGDRGKEIVFEVLTELYWNL